MQPSESEVMGTDIRQGCDVSRKPATQRDRACCAAQAQLEEDMKKAAGEGQVHLDAQLQAEWYKIQEEAKSKTSKLRTDHEALKATQARPPTARLTTMPTCLQLTVL